MAETWKQGFYRCNQAKRVVKAGPDSTTHVPLGKRNPKEDSDLGAVVWDTGRDWSQVATSGGSRSL